MERDSISSLYHNTMNRILLSSIFTFMLITGTIEAGEHTQYVNPFIGTGAVHGSLSGNNYPGATVPFGMIQLSPDTREAPDWAQASGYDYNDQTIYGFSHTRLSGTGASDLIDLLLLPTSEGRTSSNFSHTAEKAQPGYYQVMLADEGINAELTATTRTGIHRYSYPNGKEAQLIIDLDHSANKGSWNRRIINSQIRIVNDHAIEGYRIITGWAKLRKVYFYIEFSSPILSSSLRDGDRQYENTPVINGSNLHAMLRFGKLNEKPLICKVALSPVSTDNAQLNLKQEASHWDFNQYTTDADRLWEKELEKINIQGTDLQKTIFYTALYHTLIQPNTISDVNGEYMAADYTTRQLSANEIHYTTFSLWDTFRGAHPLYTLLNADRVTDFVKSMIRQYEYYGYLPVWQLWGQDNYCMIGNHSIPVIVDAILKGIPGIDIEKAYEAVYNSSVISHPNSPFEVWEKYGYMPENIQTQSVSITLEQAFDDWCVAQMAKSLGKMEDYAHLMRFSGNYKNLYNPEKGFFLPRNYDGTWIDLDDNSRHGLTEGSKWTYLFCVLQDIPGMIDLMGGPQAFSDKLDRNFEEDHYKHDNEPGHHYIYLYNYCNEPWKTQELVRKHVKLNYKDTPDGVNGNDDCGQMSAWYLFSVMGFYPVTPGSNEFAIGAPQFSEIKIRLKDHDLLIKADNLSEENKYVQSVFLDGKKILKPFVDYFDLIGAKEIRFVMNDRPGVY